MAQLFFEYGVMNAGKSIELLKVAHNYQTQGRTPFLMTSVLDDRTHIGTISSRVGLSEPAYIIEQTTNVYDIIKQYEPRPDIVLIDEAQFLTRDQVIQFAKIVDDFDIPVMAFGLKNDFTNHLFPGSEALLIFADKLEEIKTLDRFSNKKAIMNLRLQDGVPVYSGPQVKIGGDDLYLPVSRKSYYHPLLSQRKD